MLNSSNVAWLINNSVICYNQLVQHQVILKYNYITKTLQTLSAEHTEEEASDGVQLRSLSRELAADDGSTLPLFVAVSFTGCGGVLINNRSSLQPGINDSFHII